MLTEQIKKVDKIEKNSYGAILKEIFDIIQYKFTCEISNFNKLIGQDNLKIFLLKQSLFNDIMDFKEN